MRATVVLLALCLCLTATPCVPAGENCLTWDELPPLPDPLGFAGPFVGVSNGALIVAGGANFPDAPPWDGGTKVWHDRIFVLPTPGGTWRELKTRLPRPLGYGASVTTPDGIICLGGNDAERCYADVFVLRWDADREQLEIRDTLMAVGREVRIPALPSPLGMMGCAQLGNSIYLAGGQTEMKSDTAGSRQFWRLDLADRNTEAWQWQPLPWAAEMPARVLPLAAAQDDGREPCFYLFSGRTAPGASAKLLADAWCFSPAAYARGGQAAAWRKVADCPRVLMAGTAVAVGSSGVLCLGGDDGRHWGQTLGTAHPGFALEQCWMYDTVTDTWRSLGKLPANHVTTTAVWCHDTAGRATIVVPSGEVKPGIRSPRVWQARLPEPRAGFQALDYIVLVIYLLALVLMGVYFSRRENSTADFFLGSQRIPWWAAGLSIYGTQLSAITFMSMPALVYRTDWVNFVGNLMIVAVAPIVIWWYLPFFRRLQVTTAYEYLEARFHVAVRIAASLLFLLLQLGRMGVVLFLPALALSTVTGINIYYAIGLMGVLATIYTVLGGIEAVIWTDVLQVVVLLFGAVASLALIVTRIDGGVGQIVELGSQHGKFHAANLTWDYTTTALWVMIFGVLFEQLVPYTADQTVVQRYLTTRDEAAAARSIWTNAALAVPGTLVFFAVGTALWAFYKTHPDSLSLTGRRDDVFAGFIAHELPVGISGLVIAGLFAASMSSLDSSMNSMATAVTTDFYRRFRPHAEDAVCLRLARGLTLLFGAFGTGVACLLAWSGDSNMWDMYRMIIGLFGAGVAGVFMLGIFSGRGNWIGALAGLVASAAALYAVQTFTRVHFYLNPAIGIGVCVAVGWVVSTVMPVAQQTEGLTLRTLRRDA